MKKIFVVLMLALCIAGCRNNQKKVYTQADLEEDFNVSNTDVDWIALYIRCHELDSIKNILETGAVRSGKPMPALPDSVGVLWTTMLNEILLRHGNNAFGLYDSHRKDIADYLRADFINYGFITKVYLPYKATVSTQEEYGEICIKELEEEMSKCQMSMVYSRQEPSHYEDVLKQLFFAYTNNGKWNEASQLCDMVLSYLGGKYGESSREYANMLGNKADLYGKTGSKYSATVTGKRAVGIYESLLADPGMDAEMREKISEDKKVLEEKIQLNWQN
jgi:hypothetical protein